MTPAPRFPKGFVDEWNTHVRYTQHYFQKDYRGFESEDEYDWFSLLYDLNIPTKSDNRELIDYMNRYDLNWNDLNNRKTVRTFSGTTDSWFGALNWASRNIDKLYR